MWTAMYLPASKQDFDKDGFASEQDAIDWIVRYCLCSQCREEGWGSACAAEWVVAETEKLSECTDLGDVLEAAGYILQGNTDESYYSGE